MVLVIITALTPFLRRQRRLTQWVIVTNPGLEEKISLGQSVITFEPLAQTWHVKMR